MLPKNQRLTSSRIDYLLKKGKKSGNAAFTVKFLPSQQAKSRFCVIVSTKISPKAVVRNHLRQQIYETIRLHPELPKSSYDIILIAKTSLIQLKFQELQNAIITILQTLIKN